MGGTVLFGTEELSLEIDGTIPELAARTLVGDRLELPVVAGRVEVSLLFFSMKDLLPIGLPLPAIGMRYREALWRIAVRAGGVPMWLAANCDLDSQVVGAFGRVLARYPVRRALVELAADAHRANARIEVAGVAFGLDAIVTAERPAPVRPRRVLVRDEGELYEVPWDEVPGQERATLRVNASDGLSASTLGAAVQWTGTGLALRGRTHKCGFAARFQG